MVTHYLLILVTTLGQLHRGQLGGNLGRPHMDAGGRLDTQEGT